MGQLIDVLVPPLRQPLTYDLPAAMDGIEVGHRVEVPLGKRTATGFVIDLRTSPPRPDNEFQIRSVEARVEPGPCFLPGQLELFRWVAEYYGDSLSNVIDVAVPKAVPRKFKRTVELLGEPEAPVASKPQLRVLDELKAAGGIIDYGQLSRKVKGLSSVLNRLIDLGAVRLVSEEISDHHIIRDPVPAWAKSSVEINEAQRNALESIVASIHARSFSTFLLHGVTGSGKTEVYIEAIQAARAQGLGALIVVPEIALTPQLVDRFRARLGSDVALLHSGLPPRVRWDSWRALLDGRSQIAIGARSAIFAPVSRLGLIIVDEEHDSSYKQSDGLRYNARDLAIVRGKLDSCCVVLGSATPSLESFYNAGIKRYRYLRLPERHATHRSLAIEVVDLSKVKPWEMPSENISPALKTAMDEAIGRSEQVFLLYNRRGFASYLQCESCGSAIECPNCSVTMTYHQYQHALICHYCNLASLPLEFCPACSEPAKEGAPAAGHKLLQRGAGTEKIHEELERLYPGLAIDRLDRDAVSDGEQYRALLARVREGETRVLVGTQMIAKGHDLPGVTLVGIVDCDVGLHMPDFRAGERVFQLLTQASGRAGRGEKPGRVLLQTRVPRNVSIEKTLAQDFPGFAKAILKERRDLGYPPFVRLLRVVASSPEQELPAEILGAFRDRAMELLATKQLKAILLGPAPAPIAKLKTLWRWHLLIKSASVKTLGSLMLFMQALQPKTTRCRVAYDMDPQDML